MKIILNNSSIQFNRADYDWEEISVDTNNFVNGGYIYAKNTDNYLGTKIINANYCANTVQNGDIDVSSFSKIKFPVICVESESDGNPSGWCIYDTQHLDVTWITGSTTPSSNVTKYGKVIDEVKETDWVIVDLATTDIALRFSLPADYDFSALKVYGVRRT